MLNLFLMFNNYFHDVATALLITSAVVIFTLARRAEASANPEVINYFLNSYKKLTMLARISLIWILLGGIVRLVSFKSFEWANAVGKNQVPALIFKHVIIFTLVGGGLYLWRRLSQKVAQLEVLSPIEKSPLKEPLKEMR